MRIGFISRAFPAGDKEVHGTFRRMGMFIEALKGLGDLDMLFFTHPERTITSSYVRETEERLARHWESPVRIELCSLAHPRSTTGRWQEYIDPALRITDHPPYQQTAQSEHIDAVLRLLARKPDILFVHRLSAMTPLLLAKTATPPVFFDLDDIEHVAFARSVGQPPWWPTKALYYLRLPILKAWERKAIEKSHTTFVCSGLDKAYLFDLYGCTNVSVVPNAVEIPEERELPQEPTVLFLGVFAYPPNVTAADYLVRDVWPHVIAAVPGARLLIAGAHPERLSTYGQDQRNVEFLGFVEDLSLVYRRTTVVACPIFSGGGTRIKIIEAAAYGKPVVSTTVGAEGIELRPGKDLFLCDDTKTFAETCIRLLTDGTLASEMGRSARTAAAGIYDRAEVVKRIRAIVYGREWEQRTPVKRPRAARAR